MTNDGSNFSRTILIRTSDGAGRAYQYVSTRPNWAFRIALVVGLVLGLAFLALIVLPISLLLLVVLFVLTLIRRIVDGGRSLLARTGLISTRDGRKNVRVMDR